MLLFLIIDFQFFSESTVCTPNPCTHSGRCSPDIRSFTCDCTDTGYIGSTCQIGIVTVPQLPVLRVNVTTDGLVLRVKPDNTLTVHMVTSSGNLTVSPQSITFNSSTTSATFKLLGLFTGFYTLSFKLSGTDALNFKIPFPSIVYVNDAFYNDTRRSPITSSGSVKVGCFVENNNEFTAYSNLEWKRDGFSNGIIQVAGADQKLLPLSFSGGRITSNGFTNSETNNIEDDGTMQNDPSCFSDRNPAQYLTQLLNTNAFMYSVQSVFNNYAPYWIRLIGSLSLTEYKTGDLGGSLFKGSELIVKKSPCTSGLYLNPSQFYYIYKTRQLFNAYFVHRTVGLQTSVIKCFVKNIADNMVYVVLLPVNTNDSSTKIFSQVFSDVVNFNGNIDFVGFRLNISGQDEMYAHGRKNVQIGNGNIHSSIDLNGQFKWMSKNISKIFSKNKFDEFSSNNGKVDISLMWTVLKSSEALNITGRLVELKQRSHNDSYNSTITVTVMPNSKIRSTAMFDNVISLSEKHNLTVSLNHEEQGGTPFIKSTSVQRLQTTLVNSSLKFNKTLLFIKAFKSTHVTVQKYRDELIPHFNHLVEQLQAVPRAISTMSMNDEQSENIAFVRQELLNVLKRFQVLNDANNQADIFGLTKVRVKFQEFQFSANNMLKQLEYPIYYTKHSSVIKWFKISGRGDACSRQFCFKDIHLNIFHGSIISSGVCSPSQTFNTTDTLIDGSTIVNSDIGGLVVLPKKSRINIVLPSNNISSKTFLKGIVQVYNVTKETNIEISNGFLSFELNIRMFKNDSVGMAVAGTLASLARDDPVYFKFKNKLLEPSLLSVDINHQVVNIVNEMERRMRTRLLLLNDYKETANLTAKKKANEYHKLLLQRGQLTKEVIKIATVVRIAEENFNLRKQLLNVSMMNTLNINKTLYTYLINRCQPKLCLSKCVPGIVPKICQEQKVIRNIQQKCALVSTSEVRYERAPIITTRSYQTYDSTVSCHTECPPLTGFFRSIFGKRKRRGIITQIANKMAVKVIVRTFSAVGGREGELGASVGGKLFGIIGAVIGGIIGSVFGSCKRVCIIHNIPRTVYYKFIDYEKRPRSVIVSKSVCETIVNTVPSGYTSAKVCSNFENCSTLVIDSDCHKNKIKCSEIRSNITALSLNPAYKQSYFDYKQASLYLDLTTRKQEVIKKSISNIEKIVQSAESASTIANATQNLVSKALDEFNTLKKDEIKIVDIFSKNKNIMKVYNVGFEFNHVEGMQFPKRLVLNLKYNDTMSAQSEVNTLFTISNYDRSVIDAAEKIIKTTVVGLNKRKRRALQKNPVNQLQGKCIAMKKANLFLVEVIYLLREEIVKFEPLYNTSIKQRIDSEAERDKYIQRLTMQVLELYSDVGCEQLNCDVSLKEIINDIRKEISLQNKNSVNSLSWNDKLEQLLTEFELDTKSTQTEECFSFQDCMSHYFFKIEDLLKHETSQVSKVSRDSIILWKRNMEQLTQEYPDFETAKRLVDETYNSMIQTDPKDVFCGDVPVIKTKLSGVLHKKEGEKIELTVNIERSKHNYDIIWKRNNYVLKKQYQDTLNLQSSIENVGYFSCEVSNMFGKTHCGEVLVKFYIPPKLIKQPNDVTVYTNSPESKYLYCTISKSSDASITWYFNSLNSDTVERLSHSVGVLKINSASRSGYYSCKVSNNRYSVWSRKGQVNILLSKPAVDRIKIEYNLITAKYKETNRQRRDSHETLSDVLPNILTSKEKALFISVLAKAMNTSENSVGELYYSKISNDIAKISFALHGTNYSDVLGPFESWDKISNGISKDRENLFVRSILLYYKANKTLSFQVGNMITLTIDPDSIKTEGMKPVCSTGQVVLSNGFMCGKYLLFFNNMI